MKIRRGIRKLGTIKEMGGSGTIKQVSITVVSCEDDKWEWDGVR